MNLQRSKIIINRIIKLTKKGYYIESTLWYSTIIEESLLYCISSYDSLIQATGTHYDLLIKNYKKREVYDLLDEDRYTLGRLIKEFKKRFYTNRYSNLISRLVKFKKIRDSVIHKLFDERINISNISLEIKKFLPTNKNSNNTWLDLSINLLKLSVELQEETNIQLKGTLKNYKGALREIKKAKFIKNK